MKTWNLLRKNPNLFSRYFVKEYLIKSSRKFFEDRNYHELESPIITGSLPQERYIDVLEVHNQSNSDVNSSNKLGYIIPTTETFNKKILAAGLGEHFVITKVCRGFDEISPNHNPEFTMLEWYHLDANYFDLMTDCEELLRSIKLFMDEQFRTRREMNTGFGIVDTGLPSPEWKEGLSIFYEGNEIDISGTWDRLSVVDALKEYSNINLEDIQTNKDFYKIANENRYDIKEDYDWQEIFEIIFDKDIIPRLNKNKPTFVYNYPRQLCPLVMPNKENPLVCEKVELYIAGKEIANGYTELTDWKEQEKRFLEEQRARKELGKSEVTMDTDMVEALKVGLPQVAGIGMGLDRVAMIFANAKNIAEINYFPAADLF